MSSSSLFKLNSDKFYKKIVNKGVIKYKPNSIFVKCKLPQIFWMLINFMEVKHILKNINPFYKKSKVLNFNIDPNKINWECSSKQSSPSRFFSDIFWSSQKWNLIKENLGGQIKLLDIGCGKGLYLEKFIKYGAKINKYNGIDVQKIDVWEDLKTKYPYATFEEISATNLSMILKKNQPNFIFSQSCLEHIEHDVEVIEQISNYAKHSSSNVYQYHLVPSENCLWLYGLHGVRVYSPYTLKKLLRNIPDKNTTINIKALGNKNCFILHKKYIDNWSILGSKGKDIRNLKNIEYWKELKKSIIEDISIKKNTIPSFYAIEIRHLNLKK